MTENQLIASLIVVIKAGFTSRAISVGIKQSHQPTQQGAPTAPTVFLSKISDAEYGYPERLDVFDTVSGAMRHTENQRYDKTFQVNATATQDPANVTQLTAADYVQTASRILGSDVAVTALAALGIGILRIKAIRNTYFTDERGQYEAVPSFDFTVTYADRETTTIPSTTTLVPTLKFINV